MLDSAYLGASALYSIAGLIIGFTLGKIVESKPTIRKIFSGTNLMGVLVFLIGVGGTLMLAQQRAVVEQQKDDFQKFVVCQVRANTEFRESITARAAASRGQIDGLLKQANGQIRQNNAQLVLLDVTAPRDPEASALAVQQYKKSLEEHNASLYQLVNALREVDEARATNPYPKAAQCEEPPP